MTVLRRRADVLIALAAVALLAGMYATTGRISQRGLGYDGADYARMLTEGLDRGTGDTALRPVVILLNRPLQYATGDVVRTFRYMNLAYAFVLATALLWILRLYGAAVLTRTYAVLTLFLTIALARLPAFYAPQVEMGAYAAMAVAMGCILSNRRAAAGIACVVAALAREFGIMTAVFGVARDIRTRVPIWRSLGTYAPALLASIALRLVVTRLWDLPLGQGELLTTNLQFWADPYFVALYAYFFLTVFGALAFVIVAQPRRVGRFLWREPEWALFIVPIAGAASLGPDIWRYLGFLTPAAVVLFAVAIGGWRPRTQLLVLAGGAVVTVYTQRPFAAMTMSAYFEEWYPYYVSLGEATLEVAPLWPAWGWRFLVAALALWFFGAAAHWGRTDPDAIADAPMRSPTLESPVGRA